MKKILIAIVALLLSNGAISQTSPTSEKLSFSLPKGAKRKMAFIELVAKANYDHSYVRSGDPKTGLFYDVEKVKMYVVADDAHNEKNFLDNRRKSMLMDNKSGLMTWTFEDIQDANNLTFLKGTLRYPNDPFVYITIIAVDKAYTRQMVAYIEYHENDRSTGEKVVKDFLKSVNFK